MKMSTATDTTVAEKNTQAAAISGSCSDSADTSAAKEAERALADAVRLCREFPEYPDVVVSVARKTDSREWPALP